MFKNLEMVKIMRTYVCEWRCDLINDSLFASSISMQQRWKRTRNKTRRKPRHIFLFSDALIITKQIKPDRYDFRLWIQLDNLLLHENDEQQTNQDQDDHCFQPYPGFPLRISYMNNKLKHPVLQRYTMWFQNQRHRDRTQRAITRTYSNLVTQRQQLTEMQQSKPHLTTTTA